jgi:hypothetical protein
MDFEKTIGGAHMYCKLKIRIESTIDEVDIAEVQREKFESLQQDVIENDGVIEDQIDLNTNSLGNNSILFDFEDLEPVSERIKLEGDEYK